MKKLLNKVLMNVADIIHPYGPRKREELDEAYTLGHVDRRHCTKVFFDPDAEIINWKKKWITKDGERILGIRYRIKFSDGTMTPPIMDGKEDNSLRIAGISFNGRMKRAWYMPKSTHLRFARTYNKYDRHAMEIRIDK